MQQQQQHSAHSTSTAAHTNVVVLRIKRRRDESAIPVLRLEGVVPKDVLAEENDYSQSSSAVLWKRVEDISTDNNVRIVNAQLEEDVEQPNAKRRKLTVLGNSEATTIPSPRKKKKQPLKILDPLTRMVDDSLKDVMSGSKTCQEHWSMLRRDGRFQGAQQNNYILHRNEAGNLLHACALWNDAGTAQQVLQSVDNDSMLSQLLETTDADGRTPYQICQLLQHTGVQDILEAFGAGDYVYDMFYMENQDEEYPDDTPTTAELTSGVGYWTPEGELILEAHHGHDSLDHETDGDIDSNCEEYGANDYPDDEDIDIPTEARRRMDQVGYADYNEDVNGYNDHDDSGNGFLQVNDNYDEYDWEGDLGDEDVDRQEFMQHPYDYDEEED